MSWQKTFATFPSSNWKTIRSRPAWPFSRIAVCSLAPEHSLDTSKHEPGQPCASYHDGFRNLPTQQKRQAHHRNQQCWDVVDRTTGKHDNRSSYGSCCCRGDTLYKGVQLGVLRPRSVAWSQQQYNQIDRQEDSDCCHGCATKSSDQITDEGNGDYDRAGRDHRHRNCIDELPIGEPMIPLHHSCV